MLVPTRSLSTAILCCALLGEGGEGPSFQDGLGDVHKLMQRERWSDAYTLLVDLLERHEGDVAVLENIAGVREDLTRCAFWSDFEKPDPRDLISGELLSWGAASGKIKVRYAFDRLDDFEQQEHYLVHPLTFDGDYTVELEWKPPHPVGDPLPLIAMSLGRGLVGVFLDRETIDVSERGALRWSRLARAPFKSRVKLTRKDDGFEVEVDGKLVEKRDFEPQDYGRIVLANVAALQAGARLTITGNGQASWLQRVVDDAVREAWGEFEKGYALEHDLPKWILDAERIDDVMETFAYPGPRSEAQDALWEEAFMLFHPGKRDELEAFVKEKVGADCTGAFRDYFAARLELSRGDVDEAASRSERILTEDPHNPVARMLGISVLFARGERDNGITQLGELLTQHPSQPAAVTLMALIHLHEGRADQARDVIRKGLEAGAPVVSLTWIHSMLGKFERGPEWGKTHEHESAHYRVRSDIDPQTSYDAGRQLEAAFKVYARDLGKVPPDGRRSEVFIFSGESGYLAYTKDLLDEEPHNTLGLYIHTLKQLLIWNAPERERMMSTVRHEGFHQYLDRLMDLDQVPRWLNEGMAEYYEPLDPLAGERERGQVHREHVEELSPWVLLPVDEVIHSTAGTFYEMTFAYPRAWLLVHYLQHSGERERAVFDDLWRRLLAGEPREEALAGAFAGVDMAELQKAVTLHLRTLERQAR